MIFFLFIYRSARSYYNWGSKRLELPWINNFSKECWKKKYIYENNKSIYYTSINRFLITWKRQFFFVFAQLNQALIQLHRDNSDIHHLSVNEFSLRSICKKKKKVASAAHPFLSWKQKRFSTTFYYITQIGNDKNIQKIT